MSTLLKPFIIQEKLLERKLPVFTPLEFARVFATPGYQTKYFLETYTKRGLLVRFKRGLYGLKVSIPDEQTLANRLYTPSYISFEYALSFYNIIPEAVYAVTSATTKPTRNITVSGKTYIYHTIKLPAFTGYVPHRSGDNIVLIAEKEKAIVDYLYLVSLGKKTLNDRFMITGSDSKKIRAYAKLFSRTTLDMLVRKAVS